jgi:hypothetical protein
MLRKLLLAGVAAATIYRSFGQTTAQPPAAPIPDYTLFRFFFLHVVEVQNAADALKAQGKEDVATRTLVRRSAHLTNQEDALLESVAADCTSAYAAESKSGFAPSPVPGVLQQIVTNCIAALQSGMGQARFQMLYNFVTATETPNIVQAAGAKASPNAETPAAQSPRPGDTVSITDARPLQKAAEILQALYGVPISYEDPSAYAYAGDLADPLDVRAANPDARTLPPRNSSLTFVSERLKVAFDYTDAQRVRHPAEAAPQMDVAKLLQSVIDRQAGNGNPGRFKMLETAAGLVVVPIATRNGSGAIVPDQSLLDRRITFPEMDTDADFAVEAFCKALSTASGKTVRPADAFLTMTVHIGANNEVARDVLVRLLNGLRQTRGGIRNADGTLPVVRVAWTLTLQPGIYPPYDGAYLLGLRLVALERRDSIGFLVQHSWIYQQR